MMKRAPGRASAALRLRRVGSAASRPKPPRRSATSIRFRATIWANRPASAMTGLDEQLEPAIGLARSERLQRHSDAVAKVGGESGREQESARIERHHLGF